ncbi:signal peptidase II [Nocardioides sp. SOB77]|uniref:Lipoprotein signal peptidase n=1 Tax=Nocardioides oceani TaxID=3058369 RepID=A0ABT8FL44_9ACTN|nr:signal peptidase II [Nocardioides oceani]MDN4175185.1 signal peptidase II [Nocardioides oceani]
MTAGSCEAPTQAGAGRVAVLLAAATVAAVDLAAKAVSEVRLADSSVDIGLIELRLAYNPGVAFSMGDKLPAGVIVAITATISVAFAIYAWYRAPRAGWIERIAGGAVIGGAVANVVDRAGDGVVTDYLHTGWWPTFNLADTFLVTGCIVIALLHARPERTVDHGGAPLKDSPPSPVSKENS